ncbi:DUF4437 domain-containing protein [Thalassotalea agariperforans]
MKINFNSVILCSLLLAAPTLSAHAIVKQSKVLTTETLKWGYLNPLRGDKSPGATDLWGDRTKNIATGMLVKFNKGFLSPPHIHNISYRGIVIQGLMHNDDPTAENLWLPVTSFWTQPAGENHITAASGLTNLIYLEIDEGPYLVQPSDQHFDNGERPINIHASNLVWLQEEQSAIIKGKNIEISPLWQKSTTEHTQGYLLKLPKGKSGKIDTNASDYKVVIIQGDLNYQSLETPEPTHLLPGSFVSSAGTFTHHIRANNESVLYIRSNGKFTAAFE